jgi:GrpB-like predicted nucleotidyltransferase (UPF0157 family)
MRKIDVVPYNPTWPLLFAEEAAHIRQALGENCLIIHHIGSTAVSGLAAKPVIDMIPVVKDIRMVDHANPAMEALGYEAKGEFGMLFRRYFQKGGNQRTHNIHVYEEGNPEIERHLNFRDWLRGHEDDREAYARIKEELAKQYPNDILSYCIGKEQFVGSIEAKSGWDGIRAVLALTPREWAVYHQLLGNDNPTGDNHYSIVFYKGQEIVAVAYVEFVEAQEAVIHAVSTDQPDFDGIPQSLLAHWIESHGRKLVGR